MARSKAKGKADREDETKLAAWAKAVKDRDQWTDQYDGKPVKSGVSVTHPRAAHAHHLEPRANLDVRYDVRNGVTLAFETHAKVEAGEIVITGTKHFTKLGKRYINAKFPLKFKGRA